MIPWLSEPGPGIGEPPAAGTAAPCPGSDVVMAAWGLVVPLAGMAVAATAAWGIEPARLVVDVGTPAAIGVSGTDPPGFGSETVSRRYSEGSKAPDAGMAVVAGLGEPAPGVVAAPVAGIVGPWLAAMEFVGPPARRVDRESARPAGEAW